MRIEIKRCELRWDFIIYSENREVCCGRGYLTKGQAIGASFDAVMVSVGSLYESTFQSQTEDTFVYSITKPNDSPLYSTEIKALDAGQKKIEKNNSVIARQHSRTGKWKFSIKISNETKCDSSYDYPTEIGALNAGIKELGSLFMVPEPILHNFGNGPVPAHQHKNGGGGWVADTAHVDDTVFMGPEAKVYEYAQVKGFVCIYDEARVYDYAQVFNHVQICGDARIYGHSYVCNNALVRDEAKVFEDARVYDRALIENAAQIYGHAEVFNSAKVFDQARVYDFAKVHGSAMIFNCALVFGQGRIFDNALVYNNAKVTGTICNNARAYKSAIVKCSFNGDENAR